MVRNQCVKEVESRLGRAVSALFANSSVQFLIQAKIVEGVPGGSCSRESGATSNEVLDLGIGNLLRSPRSTQGIDDRRSPLVVSTRIRIEEGGETRDRRVSPHSRREQTARGQYVTLGHGYWRTRMVAMQAGLDPPSTSKVMVTASWMPPGTSVTESRTTPARTLLPTGTGEGNRTRSHP